MFIVLLSFRESWTHDQTKLLFINDEPCMIRPIFSDLNPFELKFDPFMISFDKCTASCNVLSPKDICYKRNKQPKCERI